MLITRQWLRARGACYDDEQIDELVPPAGVARAADSAAAWAPEQQAQLDWIRHRLETI